MSSPFRSPILIQYDNIITASSAIPIPKSPHSPSYMKYHNGDGGDEEDEMMPSSYNPNKRSSSAVICRFQNFAINQARGPFQSPQSEKRSPRSDYNSPPPHLLPIISHGQGNKKDSVHDRGLVPKQQKHTTSSSTTSLSRYNTILEEHSHSMTSHSSSELWQLDDFENQLVIVDDVPVDKMIYDSPSSLDHEAVFDMDM